MLWHIYVKPWLLVSLKKHSRDELCKASLGNIVRPYLTTEKVRFYLANYCIII